jgi:hypothetical protein
VPNYALRRDRRRQKSSGGAKAYYKRLLHRWERRRARLAIALFLAVGDDT